MNEMKHTITQTCGAFELIQALMHAGKYTEMRLDAALAPTGLSAAKWNALRHLMEAGGQLSLGQLAGKLSCVKSNATQLVDRLEADQLVSRLPDPDDRRAIRAKITPRGERAFAEGQRVVHAFEQELLEGYSPEEQLILNKLLRRMNGDPTGA